jgi:hypothetical protein
MKYFVVSLHRSGTLSVTDYLNRAGILAKHWPVDHDGVNLEEKIVGHETDAGFIMKVLAPVTERFDAVADVPIPVLYRELLSKYPDARFIYLYRSPFDWARSVRSHYAQAHKEPEFRPFVRALYWTYFDWRPRRIDDLTDAQLIWMHCQHTANVVSFFAEAAPSQLGCFDLTDKDCGAKLAAFVGCTTPVTFYPVNLGRSRKRG